MQRHTEAATEHPIKDMGYMLYKGMGICVLEWCQTGLQALVDRTSAVRKVLGRTTV